MPEPRPDPTTGRLIKIVKIVTALAAAIALFVGVIGRDKMLVALFGDVIMEPVNFPALVLTSNPNQFLVCPVDYCAATPHMVSPVFAVPALELRQRWMAMLKTQANIETLTAADDILQYDFIQRTKLMRFPDLISVRFIEAGSGRSTLAIYSRSAYGKSDFGANKKRIRNWLALLTSP